MPHRIKRSLKPEELEHHVRMGGIRKLAEGDRALARVQYGLNGVPFYLARGKTRLGRMTHAFWGLKGEYLGPGAKKPIDTLDIKHLGEPHTSDLAMDVHKGIYGVPRRPHFATFERGRAVLYDAIGIRLEPTTHAEVNPHDIRDLLDYHETGLKALSLYKELYDLPEVPRVFAYLERKGKPDELLFWDKEGKLLGRRDRKENIEAELIQEAERRLENKDTKAD